MVNALKNMYFMCSINEVMLPRMLHSAKRSPPTISFSFSKYFINHIITSWVQIFQKVSRLILSTQQGHYFRSIYNYNVVIDCYHCMANSRERQFRSFQKRKISRSGYLDVFLCTYYCNQESKHLYIFTNPDRGRLLSKTSIAKNLYDFRIHLNLFEISKKILKFENLI